MKVAALIPARKHSRRLPEKNWRLIGGHPLWGHAVHHAHGSGVCNPIVVSTDDERIHADLAQYQILTEIFSIEQPRFPQSYNVMLDVVCHADKALLARDHDMDAICLLQPTSPLRTPEDVRLCIERLESHAVDSVVSVTDGEDDILFREGHAGRLERISFPVVRPNGAVYAIKTHVLRRGGYWYGDFAYRYKMPKERSIDIDNELDLEMAQAAWSSLNGPCA